MLRTERAPMFTGPLAEVSASRDLNPVAHFAPAQHRTPRTTRTEANAPRVCQSRRVPLHSHESTTMPITLEAEARMQSVTTALRTITNTNTTRAAVDTDAPAPRIHLLDRIALRVGVALLLWGARTQRVVLTHEAHGRIHHSERQRESRESAAIRDMLYGPLLR